jgi:pimeloyl-ACP methyl ester carboxylesterase
MKRLVTAALGAGVLATAGVVTALTSKHHRAVSQHLGDFGSLEGELHTITAADGVRLHAEVDEADANDDLTIILVHGWMENLHNWHFQRLDLRGQVRIVSYDQRGHGRSGRTGRRDSSLEFLADDLARVIEELVPTGRIVLVGHSMGSMTIQQLAVERPDLFGERVVAVTLISTLSRRLRRGNRTLHRFSGLIRAASPVIDRGRTIDTTPLLRSLLVDPNTPWDRVVMINQMVSNTASRALADFYPIFLTLDVETGTKALSATDTVVVCGSNDRLTPLSHSRRLAEAIDRARLRIIPEAGHMLTFERAGEITDLIGEQLERVR